MSGELGVCNYLLLNVLFYFFFYILLQNKIIVKIVISYLNLEFFIFLLIMVNKYLIIFLYWFRFIESMINIISGKIY
jgi:hypothetical protein